MTDTPTLDRLTATTNPDGVPDLASLVDQTLIAGVGLMSRGIDLLRLVTAGTFDVADSAVIGTIDAARSLAGTGTLAPLIVRPLDTVQSTWQTGRKVTDRVLVGTTA